VKKGRKGGGGVGEVEEKRKRKKKGVSVLPWSAHLTDDIEQGGKKAG